jgi:hypothetical protein
LLSSATRVRSGFNTLKGRTHKHGDSNRDI